MKWCFTIGGLLLVMGGCSLTTHRLTQERLNRMPRLTLARLKEQGPPADGQVIVTDIRPARGELVAARYEHDLDLYVPAYSGNLERQPEPPDLKFIMQVWDDDWAERFRNEPGPFEVECWVHRQASLVKVSRGPGEIEQWAWDGLSKKYPGLRMTWVWVLTIGHGSTPTAYRVQSARQYGIGELVLGCAVILSGMIGTWWLRRAAADPG